VNIDPDRQRRAIARFDAANAEDPRREKVDGVERPKELLYAGRLTAMLNRYLPDASEALRLAVRCQHLQRWKIPRAEYPMTRIGYNDWRTRLRDFHAELAAGMLREVGYDEAMIGSVRSLLRKEGLKSNADAQALEDVVALVFVESYLADFVAGHDGYDAAKFLDILTRTARKMSARGRRAALTMIALPQELAPLVQTAMGANAGQPDPIRAE
jgi:hypothetical protein